MERAVVVLSALILNALAGGPGWLWVRLGVVRAAGMPAEWMRGLQRRLDREHRSIAEREMRGTLCVGLVFVCCLLLGFLVQGLGMPFLTMLVVAGLLPVRPLWDKAYRMYHLLKTEQLNEARELLEGTVWRHHALLDAHGLARAGMESVGLGFAHKIVAPALWFVLMGLPGLFFSRAVVMMTESVQGRGDEGFAKTARQIREWMHYVPVRLAALVWAAAAAFLPPAGERTPLKALINLPGNDVAFLAVMARGLHVSLGGPVSAYCTQWVGTGHARPLAGDLGRALFQYLVALLLVFVFLGLFF